MKEKINERIALLKDYAKYLDEQSINGISDMAADTLKKTLKENYSYRVKKLLETAVLCEKCGINIFDFKAHSPENNVSIRVTEDQGLDACYQFVCRSLYKGESPGTCIHKYATEILFDANGDIHIRLVIYADKTKETDSPFLLTLRVFENKFPKFEKRFYRHVDRRLKKIKQQLKQKASESYVI